MPDRDKDLVQLFVRDLDRIELPPRERWRPAQRKESTFLRTSRTILYATAVAAVLAVALLAGFALRDRGQVTAPPTASPTATNATTPAPTASAAPTTSPTLSPSPAPTAQTGAISGRISYPSDFIPPVTVYAINPNDQRIWFSVEFPGYGSPPRPTAQPGTEPGTYTVTGVAPGRYVVVAYRNDGQKPDPGLYTREAECLRRTPSGPCPDQTPVLVTVTAGQTTREIDIVSWWPGSGLMPPPPPRPPIGYGLPRECRYVLGATAPQTWLLSCPQGLTSTYLAPSLAQQGWTSCASSPKSWRKDQLAIVITDFVNRSDATGQMEQKPLSAISC